MNISNKRKVLNCCSIIILSLLSLLMLFPFLWMIFTAFKTGVESVASPPTMLPVEGWHPENFVEVFKMAPFGRYFVNTIIVAVSSTLLSLIISILAGYGLSVLNFKGKNVVLIFFISTMMIPAEMLIIQNYVTVAKMHLLNTFTGIVIPSVASGMYIYMLRETFMQVPTTLRAAAHMDGCGDFKFLYKIIVPNSIATISTVGLLSFIGAWNNFLWPLMVTNYDNKRVLTIGLMNFNQGASSRINLQMAGSLIVIMPILVLYLIFRKQIISGVAAGGIKG